MIQAPLRRRGFSHGFQLVGGVLVKDVVVDSIVIAEVLGMAASHNVKLCGKVGHVLMQCCYRFDHKESA